MTDERAAAQTAPQQAWLRSALGKLWHGSRLFGWVFEGPVRLALARAAETGAAGAALWQFSSSSPSSSSVHLRHQRNVFATSPPPYNELQFCFLTALEVNAMKLPPDVIPGANNTGVLG